jgi:hypothetical protein
MTKKTPTTGIIPDAFEKYRRSVMSEQSEEIQSHAISGFHLRSCYDHWPGGRPAQEAGV